MEYALQNVESTLVNAREIRKCGTALMIPLTIKLSDQGLTVNFDYNGSHWMKKDSSIYDEIRF